MRLMKRNCILFLMLVFLLAVFAASPCFAESAMDVKVDSYSASDGLLRLSFTQREGGSTTMSVMDAPSGYEQMWDSVKQNTTTIWLQSDSMTGFNEWLFDGFNNLKCLILDLPKLTSIRDNNLGRITYVFYTDSNDGNVAAALSTKFSKAQKVYLASTGELCKIRFGSCTNGQFVSDAPAYVKSGTVVDVYLRPDKKYRAGSIEGGEVISENRRRINSDTTFTGFCYYRGELMEEDSFGICGDTVDWCLYADGELCITGAGNIKSYGAANKWPWYGYREQIKTLSIGEGITLIPDSAFTLPVLKKATIASTVTSVGSYAFYNCPLLESAEFCGNPPTFTGYSTFCFTNVNDNLIGRFAVIHTELGGGWGDTISDATRSYPVRYAYQAKPNDFATLTAYTSPYSSNAQPVYGVNAQGVVFKLNGTNLTASVGDAYNDDNAYNTSRYNGNNDGEVVIPDEVSYGGQTYAVTYIAPDAFSNNVFLKKLTLGAKVQDIADGAFYGCTNFQEFVVSEGSGSFMQMDGILYDSQMGYLYVVPAAKRFSGVYEVPSSITRIGTGAFYGCTGIDTVEIRARVREIGDEAFYKASGIHTIRILNDVERIGERAFNYCTALSDLEIYDGLLEFGASPFVGCTSLSVLRLPFLGTDPEHGATLASLFGNAIQPKDMPVMSLWVGGGTLVNGVCASCEKLVSAAFGTPITALPNSCFENCTALRCLDIGRENTYYSGSDDGLATIRKGVTTIGDRAFRNCASLARFRVETENPSFSNDYWGALYDKAYTKLVCFPPASEYQYYCVKGSAATIGSYAFSGCSNLITVNIPNKETQPLANSIEPFPPAFRICVHQGSKAESTYGTLKCWIIEDFTPKSMEIVHLSDRVAFETGAAPDYPNLYFSAIYPGVTILLDEMDYSLALSGTDAGAQTVTATYNQKDQYGKPVTQKFHVCLFEKQEGYTVAEYTIPSSAVDLYDLNGLAALYNADGKMLLADRIEMIDNVYEPNCKVLRCACYLPAALLDGSASTLKLFTLDGDAPGANMKVLREIWLPTPQDLTWGTLHVDFDPFIKQRNGQISWRADADAESCYLLKVYKVGAGQDGADLLINRYGEYYSASQIKEYFDSKNYLINIQSLGAGQYYFTVQSICRCVYDRNSCAKADGCDIVHADSLTCTCGRHHNSTVAKSEIFSYTRPEKTLEPCTAPRWSEKKDELLWTLPADTSEYGGYTITFYYGREYNDYLEKDKNYWRVVGSVTNYFDAAETYLTDPCFGLMRRFYSLNENRAGFYWFTVTAEPKDICTAVRSAESEWSDAYYYRGVSGYEQLSYIFVKEKTAANNPNDPYTFNGKRYYAYDVYCDGNPLSNVYLNDKLPKDNPAGIYTYTKDYNNIYTLTPVEKNTYQQVVTVTLTSGNIVDGNLTLTDASIQANNVSLEYNRVVDVTGTGIGNIEALEAALEGNTVTVMYLARKTRLENWYPVSVLYVTAVQPVESGS